MAEFTLNCFGVGDGWPCPDRHHSSFLYRLGDTTLLVDCGEPISRSFKASGLSYELIDAICLSHLHFDHVGGFFMLMQGFWLEGRRKELVIRAPAGGIPPIRKMLHAGCIFDELFSCPLRFEAWQGGKSVQVRDVTLTPYPTTHLASFQRSFSAKYPENFGAFCFLLEHPDYRIGHSADIGAVEDLKPLVEKSLDLLVCELAHINPEEAFQFIAKSSVKRVLFIHLSREAIAERVKLEARAYEVLGAGRVRFAHDGDEIRLW